MHRDSVFNRVFLSAAAGAVLSCVCCLDLHAQPVDPPRAPEVGPAPSVSATQPATRPTSAPSITEAESPETSTAQNLPAEAKPPGGWRFQIAPFLWAAGVDVNTSLGDGEVEGGGSADFDEIVVHLDFALMVHAEAAKGKFSFLLDGMYVDLGIDGENRFGGDLHMDLMLAVVDPGVAYRVADLPLAHGLGLDVLGGLRYTHVEIALDPATFASRSRSADVLDPYVGARAALRVSDKLTLGAKGTIGGFGIGSDLAWTANGVVDYRFTPGFSIFAGYQVMDYEFDDLGGRENFELDIQLSGPFFGVAFNF